MCLWFVRMRRIGGTSREAHQLIPNSNLVRVVNFVRLSFLPQLKLYSEVGLLRLSSDFPCLTMLCQIHMCYIASSEKYQGNLYEI
jgi:hypothetical protein